MLPTKFKSNQSFRKEKKWRIDFQDGGHAGHLGFLIWKVLDIFDLLVTPLLPSKFQDNWPFFSEVEVNKRAMMAL